MIDGCRAIGTTNGQNVIPIATGNARNVTAHTFASRRRVNLVLQLGNDSHPNVFRSKGFYRPFLLFGRLIVVSSSVLDGAGCQVTDVFRFGCTTPNRILRKDGGGYHRARCRARTIRNVPTHFFVLFFSPSYCCTRHGGGWTSRMTMPQGGHRSFNQLFRVNKIRYRRYVRVEHTMNLDGERVADHRRQASASRGFLCTERYSP